MADLTGMMQAAAGSSGETNPNAWDISKSEYDLPSSSVLWEINNYYYTGNVFDISAQESAPTGVFFRPDGTKMFVIGSSGDDINQYDLSAKWIMGSATFATNKAVSVDTAPSDVYFRPDGFRVYIVGSTNDKVYQSDLANEYGISGANFNTDFSVSTEETVPTGLFFKPDGTKMYVCGTTGDDVNEYDLSTAWDITSSSYLRNFSVSTQDSAPGSLSFRDDGTKMYLLGNTNGAVYQYDLSTGWNVSTASYVNNFNIASATGSSNFTGIYFKDDGAQFFAIASGNDSVYQFAVGGTNITDESTVRNFTFKPDGTKMYTIGTATDRVREYSLSIPWDIYTISTGSTESVSAQEANPTGVFFKPDGTKMYIIGTSSDSVHEYNLSPAWDITSSSFVQSFSVATQDTLPIGLYFKDDGTKMYILGSSGDDVNEYSLSTAWDISTASYVQNFSLASEGTNPTGFYFSPDGLKMYVTDDSSITELNQYDLGSAWDVSTAVYQRTFYIEDVAPAAEGIFFKPDGTKFFIYNNGGLTAQDRIHSYSISPI